MKVFNISAVLLSALFSVAVSAALLGGAFSENGKIFSGKNYVVVKKDMKKREQIKPYDHPGFKTLIFTAGKGSFDVTLNQTEKHTVGAGSVLRSGGNVAIEAAATEDADVAIILTK